MKKRNQWLIKMWYFPDNKKNSRKLSLNVYFKNSMNFIEVNHKYRQNKRLPKNSYGCI